MVRVIVIFALITSAFLGCKSSKKPVYISPHTDTLKMPVQYSEDSIEIYVQRIIENDSIFNIRDLNPGFAIVNARQQDSIMFVTVKSFNGCSKMSFNLYQSSLVFKSYPPRIRMRLEKTGESDCNTESPNGLAFHTIAFDIRGILDEYGQATISFKNSRANAFLKKE